MKRMKKIFAIALALVMTIAMAIPAFADAPSATITVANADKATKVKYVQVIEPDTTAETGWKFSSTDIATVYKNALGASDDQTAIKMLVNAETANTYEKITAATASQIATASQNVVDSTSINMTENDATPKNKITVSKAGVYVIMAEETGYTYSAMAAYVSFGSYDTTTGVPSTLETKGTTAKKTKTTVDKTSISATNNAGVTEIGKTETYTVTGEVPYIPDNTTNRYYIWKDTIEGATYVTEAEGTTNAGKVKVTVTVGDGEAQYFYGTVAGDGKSFTVDLSSIVTDNSNASKSITVSYQAKVTAVTVKNTVNVGKNEGDSTYGTDDDSLTTLQATITKTGENNKKLENAYFILLRKVNNEVTGVAKVDSNGLLIGWYASEDAAKSTKAGNVAGYAANAAIATDSNGTVTVQGLTKSDSITYEFKEIQAPEGYSVNTTNAVVGYTDDDKNTAVIEGTASMTDTKLSALPSTGGIGTTIFTIAGCAIIVVAGSLLIVSRRKKNA